MPVWTRFFALEFFRVGVSLTKFNDTRDGMAANEVLYVCIYKQMALFVIL